MIVGIFLNLVGHHTQSYWVPPESVYQFICKKIDVFSAIRLYGELLSLRGVSDIGGPVLCKLFGQACKLLHCPFFIESSKSISVDLISIRLSLHGQPPKEWRRLTIGSSAAIFSRAITTIFSIKNILTQPWPSMA